LRTKTGTQNYDPEIHENYISYTLLTHTLFHSHVQTIAYSN